MIGQRNATSGGASVTNFQPKWTVLSFSYVVHTPSYGNNIALFQEAHPICSLGYAPRQVRQLAFPWGYLDHPTTPATWLMMATIHRMQPHNSNDITLLFPLVFPPSLILPKSTPQSKNAGHKSNPPKPAAPPIPPLPLPSRLLPRHLPLKPPTPIT